MSRILTRLECLQLDIETYNKVIEIEWIKDKIKKNLSGDLSICEYCGRKNVITCICDEGVERWNRTLAEVQAISERDRSDDF